MFFKKKNKEKTNDVDIKKSSTQYCEKICTLPIYFSKKLDAGKDVTSESFFKETILQNDYYLYALSDDYTNVLDNKKWIFDGTTALHYEIHEVKVRIKYCVEDNYINNIKFTNTYIDIIEFVEYVRKLNYNEALKDNILVMNNEEYDEVLVNLDDFLMKKYKNTMKEVGFTNEFIEFYHDIYIKPLMENKLGSERYVNVIFDKINSILVTAKANKDKMPLDVLAFKFLISLMN